MFCSCFAPATIDSAFSSKQFYTDEVATHASGNPMLGVNLKTSKIIQIQTPLYKYMFDVLHVNFPELPEILQRLRDTVVKRVGPLPTQKEKLIEYYKELVRSEDICPISENKSHARVEFEWFDSFQQDQKVVVNNVQFEQASVLFNVAAICSQLALDQNRDEVEGLRVACKFFQESAGIFNYLLVHYCEKLEDRVSPDLSTPGCRMLEQLMLAQAQECFYEKAVLNSHLDKELTPKNLSKIVKQVQVYYGNVQRQLELSGLKKVIDSSWVEFVQVKAKMYEIECRRQQSKTFADDDSGIAERIMCLRYSSALMESIAQKGRKLNIPKLSALEKKVARELKEAERDNETIFLYKVQSDLDLPPVQPINLARITPFQVDQITSTSSRRSNYSSN